MSAKLSLEILTDKPSIIGFAYILNGEYWRVTNTEPGKITLERPTTHNYKQEFENARFKDGELISDSAANQGPSAMVEGLAKMAKALNELEGS